MTRARLAVVKELMPAFMESPFYFRMSLRDRLLYVKYMAALMTINLPH